VADRCIISPRPLTANEILDAGKADVIMLARELLRNADFVFDAANGMSCCFHAAGE
jgi:2,4-dienoyl-CoA reductase-like NADH-dependent reductase (Old Yellow Enzyme family)